MPRVGPCVTVNIISWCRNCSGCLLFGLCTLGGVRVYRGFVHGLPGGAGSKGCSIYCCVMIPQEFQFRRKMMKF